MNEELNGARVREPETGSSGRMGGSRRLGVLGGVLMATSLFAMPFVADAAVPAAGCPDGTYQSWTESYNPAQNTIQISNFPITYVWVDTANDGRFIFGDGSTMNNSSIDVAGAIGVPATGAGFCKGTAATTTTTTPTTTVPPSTTTSPTTSTTTTIPPSTTTSTTTTTTTTTTVAPSTTSTTSTVPSSTSTPTTSTPSTSTPTTSTPSTSTPTTSTPTVPTSNAVETGTPPPGTETSSTSTTMPTLAALPPAPPSPPIPPLGAGSPGPSPIGTTLPETGSSSLTGVLLSVAVLGFGMVLVAISRRSAT